MTSDFEWKHDQCPHCAYTLCDHVAGTQGVNDARFRCGQCHHVFHYGAIVEAKGPLFVRREIQSGTETFLSWPRGWNRFAFQQDFEKLLAAVLAGEEVRTKWATYRLRGFNSNVSSVLGEGGRPGDWRTQLYRKLVGDCQRFGRTTRHTEELLENVVESIEPTTGKQI